MHAHALMVETRAVGMGLLNCTGGGARLDDGTRRVRSLNAMCLLMTGAEPVLGSATSDRLAAVVVLSNGC